jgi:hypothetical protein
LISDVYVNLDSPDKSKLRLLLEIRFTFEESVSAEHQDKSIASSAVQEMMNSNYSRALNRGNPLTSPAQLTVPELLQYAINTASDPGLVDFVQALSETYLPGSKTEGRVLLLVEAPAGFSNISSRLFSHKPDERLYEVATTSKDLFARVGGFFGIAGGAGGMVEQMFVGSAFDFKRVDLSKLGARKRIVAKYQPNSPTGPLFAGETAIGAFFTIQDIHREAGATEAYEDSANQNFDAAISGATVVLVPNRKAAESTCQIQNMRNSLLFSWNLQKRHFDSAFDRVKPTLNRKEYENLLKYSTGKPIGQ